MWIQMIFFLLKILQMTLPNNIEYAIENLEFFKSTNCFYPNVFIAYKILLTILQLLNLQREVFQS